MNPKFTDAQDISLFYLLAVPRTNSESTKNNSWSRKTLHVKLDCSFVMMNLCAMFSLLVSILWWQVVDGGTAVRSGRVKVCVSVTPEPNLDSVRKKYQDSNIHYMPGKFMWIVSSYQSMQSSSSASSSLLSSFFLLYDGLSFDIMLHCSLFCGSFLSSMCSWVSSFLPLHGRSFFGLGGFEDSMAALHIVVCNMCEQYTWWDIKSWIIFFVIQLYFTGKKLKVPWANAGIPGSDWFAAQHEDECW